MFIQIRMENKLNTLLNNISNVDPIWHKYPPAAPNTSTAIRYLKRCCGDVYEAEKLYRKMLEWRVINNINTRYTPNEFKNFYNHEFTKYYNHSFRDIKNIPIEILTAPSNFSNIDFEAFKDHYILKEEIMFKKYNISKEGIILIYDLKNMEFTISFLKNFISIFKDFSLMADNYYAGRARKIYIINIPTLFTYAYGLVKYVIPQETTDITNIYDCYSTEQFLDDIQENVKDFNIFSRHFYKNL